MAKNARLVSIGQDGQATVSWWGAENVLTTGRVGKYGHLLLGIVADATTNAGLGVFTLDKGGKLRLDNADGKTSDVQKAMFAGAFNVANSAENMGKFYGILCGMQNAKVYLLGTAKKGEPKFIHRTGGNTVEIISARLSALGLIKPAAETPAPATSATVTTAQETAPKAGAPANPNKKVRTNAKHKMDEVANPEGVTAQEMNS